MSIRSPPPEQDVPPRRVRRASVNRTPQQVIDDFWNNFQTRAPGKITSIVPQKVIADKAALRIADRVKRGSQTAAASYEEAAEKCRAKVAHIVKECRRVNQRYRDPHFDIEVDLYRGHRDCLEGLDNRAVRQEKSADDSPAFKPQAVKRVVNIFDKPEFFIDGPTANDVLQGSNGDCWLMAALCTLSNKPGLIERVCVAHDAAVGVYGFVFHRDGEWLSEIIDDKLYLKSPDYDDSEIERDLLEDRVRTNSEEQYRKVYQSNSSALYFAQCENPNETWLPLLEKAYAKAHGDYQSIDYGHMGEGIEDLTGGVTSELYTTDILDKEHFWYEELQKANDTFLFGCSTGVWGHGRGDRGGIVEGHAYSVMRAVEMDGKRLVLLRNPWGRHEWKGPWSDGSKEWTAEWIQKLNHQFGDDGSFWISYEDLLRKYQSFHRTRLFDSDWKVASSWTTMTVPWESEYNETKFAFSLARAGPAVIVLSQLDNRYFRGLEGQYTFRLSFRLHHVRSEPLESVPATRETPGTNKTRKRHISSIDSTASKFHSDDDADYVVRCQFGYGMMRSASVELDLEAGQYIVLVCIKANRSNNVLPAEEVVRRSMPTRREKLIRMGLAYDVAHSKGRVVETPAEKRARLATTKRRDARQRATFKAQFMDAHQAVHRDKKQKRKEERKVRAKEKAKIKRRAERLKARAGSKKQDFEESKDTEYKKIVDEEKKLVWKNMDGKATAVDRAEKKSEERVEEKGVKGGAETKLNDEHIKTDVAGNGSAEVGSSAVEEVGESDRPVAEEADKRDGPVVQEIGKVQSMAMRLRDEPDQTLPPRDSGLAAQKELPPGPKIETLGSDTSASSPEAKDAQAIPVSTNEPGTQTESSSAHAASASSSEGKDTPTASVSDNAPLGQPTAAAEALANAPTAEEKRESAQYSRRESWRGSDLESELDLSSISSLSDVSDDYLDAVYEWRRSGNGRGQAQHNGGPRNDYLVIATEGGRGAREPSPPNVHCHGKHCPRAESDDEEPWNAVAVVGLRIYYKEVDGDKERNAAAEEKIKAAKAKQAAKTAKKKAEKSAQSESTSSSKASKAPKPSKETPSRKAYESMGKDVQDIDTGDRDPKTDKAASGDHIVQLWVERPHPFMPESSDSESESDSDDDSDGDEGDDDNVNDSTGGGDGAIGLGAENILDIDDTLKDSTVTTRRRK